jgi:hypothetical protein
MYAAAHPLVEALAATVGDVLDRLTQEDHLSLPMPLVRRRASPSSSTDPASVGKLLSPSRWRLGAARYR